MIPDAPSRGGFLVELLEHRFVRLLLGVLIVVSVLPFDRLEAQLRPVFLGIFGVELALRLWLVAAGRSRPDRAEWLFIVFDLIAVVSFLPLEQWLGTEAHWLRAFRLVRLLVLVRFTRALARDVYRVLTRREQLQQLGLITVAVLSLSFVGAVVLGQIGVRHDFDGVEGAGNESFWDQIWWSFRQVESPDNLVANLGSHPLVLITSLGLTIMGIFVFSYLIGVGANVVEQVLRAERRRAIGYRDHTLVVGPVHESELLVREFVRIYEKNRALRRIAPKEIWNWLVHRHPRPRRQALPRMALLGLPDDPPSYLYEPGMRWVVYRQGEGADPDALERVNVADVKRVVLLAPRGVADPDAVTIARLAAIRARNSHAHVFLEIRDSENVELAKAVGGGGTFALDLGRVLGLFLCHHLVVPGIDRLLSELLSASGSEVYTHLFVDPWERRELAAHCTNGEVDFGAMAHHAQTQLGVTLMGVFVGEPIQRRRRLVPVDRVRPWVNPLEPPQDPDVHALGLEGERDRIPVESLQGLFGMAETYVPLRSAARALQTGRMVKERPALGSAIAEQVRRGVDFASEPPPQRVLIVGYSAALPHMIDAVAHFVPNVELRVVIDGDSVTAAARFEALGVTVEQAERELEREGRLLVFHRPRDLAKAATGCVGEGIDAAVFLADEESPNVDATTALRVLHFTQSLDCDEGISFLVEVEAMHRGVRLHDQLARLKKGHRLTLLSTEQVQNYFMVHSAFVPGLTGLYERLLGARGQEIVRLPIRGLSGDSDVSFGALRQAFAKKGIIPLAVDTRERLFVNPGGNHTFPACDIEALYAVADADGLEARFIGDDEEE